MTARQDVIGALSQALGDAKARSVVSEAAKALTFPDEFEQDQALRLLEWIAAQPGIVGITARFAKSRLILHWGQRAATR